MNEIPHRIKNLAVAISELTYSEMGFVASGLVFDQPVTEEKIAEMLNSWSQSIIEELVEQES